MTPAKNIDNDYDYDYGHFCELDVNNNIPPIKYPNYSLVMKKICQTNSEYYLNHYHDQHKQMYGDPNSIEYDINTADYYYDYEYCGIKTIHRPNYKREFTNIILDKYAGTINTFVTVLTITTSGLLLYMLFI
jgi:hypothetical protein